MPIPTSLVGEPTEDPQGGGPADYYSNENRIINFVARALGQLSAEEFRLSLEALTQTAKAYDSITVEKVAWDGSYFTYTSPALFIREVDTSYGPGTIVPGNRGPDRLCPGSRLRGMGSIRLL